MRSCPQCHAVFDDDMSFCLEDGTPLAEPSLYHHATESFSVKEQPTVDARQPDTTQRPGEFAADFPREAQPAPPVTARRTSYLVPLLITVLSLGTLFITAGLIGAWYFLSSERALRSSGNSNNEPPRIILPNSDSNAATNSNGNTNAARIDQNANVTSSKNENARPGNQVVIKPSPSPQPSLKDNDKNTRDEAPQASPSTRPPAPKTISAGVLNGKAISLPKPPYPPAARAVRASGAVSVQVLIDESGRVVSATAVSGHPLLQASAVAAARQARFSPTMLSGQPVKVSGVITYNFVP